MKILETERTILREVTPDDAEFILDLLNQPSFIKYIGDRNVRTVEQAREYVESRFTASYNQFGFGMWAVELKPDSGETQKPITNYQLPITNPLIGICGFVKRDTLPCADIGFAFLAEYERQGYGFETARTTLAYGRDVLNFERVLAITSQNNEASGKLLEKLGFKFDELIDVSHTAEKLKLFSTELNKN